MSAPSSLDAPSPGIRPDIRTSPPRRVLVLVNPASAGGETQAEGIAERLAECGLEASLRTPDSAEAMSRAIRQEATDFDAVVVGGGDGTVHSVLDALHEAGKPLGILPLGTANDLAVNSLAIPEELEGACQVIAQGRLQTIDLGVVNDVRFVNVAHIGLGARVKRKLSSRDKRLFGPLGYVVGVWRALRDNRSFRVQLECDGRSSRARSIQIAVGNGCCFGGGMRVHPEARLDDGMLHAYSLPPRGWLGLIVRAVFIRQGQLDGREELTLTCRELTVHTRKPHHITADGEQVGHTPAVFRIEPAALEVFVPDFSDSAARPRDAAIAKEDARA